jgi:hypothetical protein
MRHSAVVRAALSRVTGAGVAQSELKLVSPGLALGHVANFSRTVRSANEKISTQASGQNATSTGNINHSKTGAGNIDGQQRNNTGRGMGGMGTKTTRTQTAAPPNDAGIAEKPSNGDDNSPRPAPNHTDERAADSIKIASYVGARRNRLPHGQGKAKYADNSTYEGEFADGKAHGRGTWYSACGTMSHTGEWKEGKRHGQGTSTMDDVTLKGVWPINLTNKHLANYTVSYTDGLTFKGTFTALTKRHLKNAKLTGTGTIRYPDRSVYTGAFEKGLRQGQGKTVDAKGKVLYEGLYDKDLPVTEASLTAAAAVSAAVTPIASTAKATKVNEDATEPDYQGDLVNGVRHGYGTLTDYDAGFTYEGNFQHGVPHGEGRCQYSNGAVYEGTWTHGVRTGPGTYFDRHGNRLTGTWLGRRLEPNTQEYEVYVASTQTTYVGAFGRMKLKREHDDVRVPSGEGKIRYSNGWVYTGTIVEGQPKSAAAKAAGPAASTATEKVGGGGARGTQQSR